MGLRKMWRKVRSLSERPHNLIAISDLRLGCDLRPGHRFDQPRPTDAPLVSFLDWHAPHRSAGKPWRLILNGDIVDFVAITLVPEGPAPFEVSSEERELGLSPSEAKCVWKLRRTCERHPAVFDALARFVQKGNSLHIIRGNHDSEWRWPAVQQELRALLAARGVTRRRLEKLVEFHDWFYLEPGFFYAEHGHAHDHYSVQSDFFEEHGGQMEMPLSSKVLHYFANRYREQVEPADEWRCSVSSAPGAPRRRCTASGPRPARSPWWASSSRRSTRCSLPNGGPTRTRCCKPRRGAWRKCSTSATS